MHLSFAVIFAGLWPLIWHYGIGVGLIIILILAAFFSPILKRDFAYGAVVVAAFLAAFTYGVSTGEHRVQAQWSASIKAADEAAEQARAQAIRDVGRRRGSAGAMRLRLHPVRDKYQRGQH